MQIDINVDKTIDLNSLHYEWSRQVDLVHFYGQELALAETDVEHAKEAVDVGRESLDRAKATVEIKVRKAFEEEGKKSTEAQVAAAVLLNLEFQAAQASYHKIKELLIDKKYQLGMTQAAYNSIVSRRNSLENQVELFVREYWGIPQEPKHYKEWSQKRFTTEVRDQVREKANQAALEAGQSRGRRT